MLLENTALDDFVRAGVLHANAGEWAGLYTLTLKDGESIELWEGEGGLSGVYRATSE